MANDGRVQEPHGGFKMLVLTRKVGTTFIVDDKIKITVVSIDDNKVRIGIDAPKNIKIYREEVYPQKNGE